MEDLRTALSDEALRVLRQNYDAAVMVEAASGPFAIVYPPLDPWVRESSNTFFVRSTLPARDRERCVIALLTVNGTAASLGIHIYWGLMEGMAIEEVCQTISLAGLYMGMPRVAFGMTVCQHVLRILGASSRLGSVRPDAIVATFVAELR